jgi:protein-S-isoprenylcysteine O-methyltransferase Ste14
MVKIGNFFFHYRNYLFPFFYLLLFVPSPLIFEDFRLAILVGGTIALMGQATRWTTIGLIYIIRGGKDRQVYAEKLVTEGLFSHSRNPMYVGNVLMLLGTGILANSLFFFLIVTPFFVFVYQAIIRAEENFLQNKFGIEFDQYMNKVNRWVPNLKGISNTFSNSEFKGRRVLLKEYNTTFVWLMGCILLIMKHVYLQKSAESFQGDTPLFGFIIGVTVLVYGTVKFLKKTKRLQSN